MYLNKDNINYYYIEPLSINNFLKPDPSRKSKICKTMELLRDYSKILLRYNDCD